MLVIKQCLKFLDTLCLSLKDKPVFYRRQGNQIRRVVIRFNSIEMVNKPTFGNWLAMGLFPDKDMLSYITTYSSWMVWLPNKDITVAGCPSPFPAFIVFSSYKQSKAFLTILRRFVFKLATIRARIIVSLPARLCMPCICTLFRAINLTMPLQFSLKSIPADLAKLTCHTIHDIRFCPFCQANYQVREYV